MKFTDNGLENAAGTSINNTEHVWTFTVGASPIAAGTTLNFGYNNPTTGKWNGPASGTTSANLTGYTNSGLSTSGDQLFVYQGTGTGANFPSGNPSAFSGTLVSGINFGILITSGAADSNRTYAPTSLVNGNAWVNGGNFDNGYYNGTRTGLSNALFRAATTNTTNFSFSNSATAGFDRTTSFTIGNSASIHWDANGSTANDGGTGTWDATTNDRFKNGASGTTYFRWVDSSTNNDHTAVFGGTAGTVSVASGGVTASGLSFTTTGYTLQNNSINLTGTAPAVDADVSVAATISSQITGSAGLTKSGLGTVSLTAASNTYSGATSVSAGSLFVNGSLANTTSTSVSADAILAANGTIANGVSIASSGKMAVGADDTTSTLGSVTVGSMALSGTLEFGATGALTYDKLISTGALAVTGGTIAFKTSAYTVAYNTSFDIVDFGSFTGTPTFDFSGASVQQYGARDTSAFATSGVISYVPEPSSSLLLGAFGSLALLRRRR